MDYFYYLFYYLKIGYIALCVDHPIQTHYVEGEPEGTPGMLRKSKSILVNYLKLLTIKIMEYIRVIPRDLFNESKLLKCIGRLALLILNNAVPNNIDIRIKETGKAFKITQNEDGELSIINYPIKVNGEIMVFKTKYNSKDNYPLYCQTKEEEDFLVFNENGDFDIYFIDEFKK